MASASADFHASSAASLPNFEPRFIARCVRVLRTVRPSL